MSPEFIDAFTEPANRETVHGRAETLRQIASLALKNRQIFENTGDITNWFRPFLDEELVAEGLKTATRRPFHYREPSAYMKAVLEAADEQQPSLRSAALSESFSASRFLTFTRPSLLSEVDDVFQDDPFLAGYCLATLYHHAKKPTKGRPRSEPTSSVAVRVIAIEALRLLCGMSLADARRRWNGWFPALSDDDESGKEFNRDFRRVHNFVKRHILWERTAYQLG